MTLTSAQDVLVRVALDDVAPAALAPPERAVARQLFGPVDTVPEDARAVVALLKGARMGGTWLSSLYLLYRALTADLSGLAAGERAFAIAVAPDTRLAKQALRYISGAAHGCPSIDQLVGKETSDNLTLRRPDGCEVDIAVLPASRGGAATRGRTLVAALLDESSFFRDDHAVVNDAEVYRSVVVRVIQGGKTLVVSTAWTETGLLWRMAEDNHGAPQTCIAAIAPTLLMRPDDSRLHSVIAAERERDPENAQREFDCVPFSGGADNFFDPASVKAAADIPPLKLPGAQHAAGCDFAFRSDNSAVAIVRCRDDHYELVEWAEKRPSKGQPLKPSEVVAQFAEVAGRYNVSLVAADAHYLESVREHLKEHAIGIEEAPGGQTGKSDTYVALRQLLREGRLRIPPNARRVIQQLQDVVAKPTPGGGLSISSPRRRGAGHGDLVSALVLAVWSAERFSRHFEIHVPNVAPDIGFRDFGGRGFG